MATPLPSGYTFGKVVGQAIRAVGDSPDDPDYHPEANPITGKKCVSFAPKVAQVVTPDNGVATMVLQDKIECDMNENGQLIRNGEDPGEIGVWLYTGVWTVSFTGVMNGIQSFDILVTEFHAEDPLDLFANMATPIPPSDPVTTLVVPSGGATGDILTWDPEIGGLKWIARTAFPDAEYVAQAQQAAQTSVDAKNVSVSSKDTAVLAKDDAVQAKNDAQTFAANFNTWFLRGNGSPLNVVTPTSAGVQYVDTAQTCGARVWISTGTTSRAWTVVDGDTGIRRLESLVAADKGVTAQWLGVRRLPDRVEWYVYLVVTEGLSSGKSVVLLADPLPPGFGNISDHGAFDSRLNVAGSDRTVYFFNRTYPHGLANPIVWNVGASLLVNVNLEGHVQNPITGNWPTTLPGTPA